MRARATCVLRCGLMMLASCAVSVGHGESISEGSPFWIYGFSGFSAATAAAAAAAVKLSGPVENLICGASKLPFFCA